ncbi:MAG: FAD-dependent oxidoreductase [Methanomicrobiaceae archaeon]|nr:FAD-dependent oxidoreductase [Methanomicrobiaceae archaeon]
MPSVKVYSTKNCPYCRMTKSFLERLGVGVQYIDVGEDRLAAMEMVKLSGQRGVPVTVFGDEVIVGFNPKRFRELFGSPAEDGVFDTVIIGAGPAGLTAAVYCARKQLKTIIISENIGGQATWSWQVENYMGFRMISGEDLIRKFEDQVHEADVRLELDSVQRVAKDGEISLVSTVSGNTYRSRTVIVASGKLPRTLGIEGEDRLVGRGISVCPTCDAPLYRDRDVVVVGGGNSALQTAIEMSRIARSVTLVARSTIKADEVYKIAFGRLGIPTYLNHQVVALQGDEFLEGIVIRERTTGKETAIATDGLFLEIGLIPNVGFLGDLLSRNERNEIIIDENARTSVDGIFAAGDVTCIKGKQIIIAAGEGAKAALGAHEYLLKRQPVPAGGAREVPPPAAADAQTPPGGVQ